MKMKSLSLTIMAMFIAVIAYCQHQLYFENFEGASNSFTLNDTAKSISKNMQGNNKWIVNNVFKGTAGYSTTLPEDSTYAGNMPAGTHYMHIYDSASGQKNDNYNPND